MKLKAPLVLASASPQRRKLLRSMGLSFKIVPSRVKEHSRGRDWRKLVKSLALLKARAVAKSHPEALVVGADTVVVCRGELLLKPKDKADARRILSALNGRWHRVYTGVALVRRSPRLESARAVVSRVKARRLGEKELLKLAGKHMDKSGAYAVQDRRDPFISEVVGPMDNVIGFPRETFRRMLAAVRLSAALLFIGALARAAELRLPWGPAFEPVPAPADPLPPSEGGEAAPRIDALRPLLDRLGFEVRGSAVGWKGEAALKEPKLSAYLDEIEYLAKLGKKGDKRKGTDNNLSDRDRHRIGCRFFAPDLAPLGITVSEAGSTVELDGPNGSLERGPLDLYLLALEKLRSRGAALTPFRALKLSAGDSGGWTPSSIEAARGEFVSIELANERKASGVSAGFHMDRYVDFREVPLSASTTVSFPASKAGAFHFYDPAFPERGKGTLNIQARTQP